MATACRHRFLCTWLKFVQRVCLNMWRSHSLEARESQCMFFDWSKRSRSAPPSTHIDFNAAHTHLNLHLGRAGVPPAKAPPPLVASGEQRRIGYHFLPVMYELSGNPVIVTSSGRPLVLILDFTHTVRDVERALQYTTQHLAKIISPASVLPTDRVLTLCAMRGCSQIDVILTPNGTSYIV